MAQSRLQICEIEQGEGTKQEVQQHPLVKKENSPKNIMDLPITLRSLMMRHMMQYSMEAMLKWAFSCREMYNMMRTDSYMWKKAAERDYGVTAVSTNCSAYRHYQFLHQLKRFEGKFIQNRLAKVEDVSHHPPLPLHLIEVEFNTPDEVQVSLWDSGTSHQGPSNHEGMVINDAAEALHDQPITKQPPAFKISPSKEHTHGHLLTLHSVGEAYWNKNNFVSANFFKHLITLFIVIGWCPLLFFTPIFNRDHRMERLESAVNNLILTSGYDTLQPPLQNGTIPSHTRLQHAWRQRYTDETFRKDYVHFLEQTQGHMRTSRYDCLNLASDEAPDHQVLISIIYFISDTFFCYDLLIGYVFLIFACSALFMINDLIKSTLQQIGWYQNERWTLDDWVEKNCTFAHALLRRNAFVSTMTQAISEGFLIHLPRVCGNSLDCQYLMEVDGSLPHSLPLPGVYECGIDQLTVSFSAHTIHIDNLLCQRTTFLKEAILVPVSSAMQMTVNEQLILNHEQYMAFEKGLDGNPNKLTHPSPLVLPMINGVLAATCRAWYTPGPSVHDMEENKRWKLLVRDPMFFILIVGYSYRVFRRCPIQV